MSVRNQRKLFPYTGKKAIHIG